MSFDVAQSHSGLVTAQHEFLAEEFYRLFHIEYGKYFATTRGHAKPKRTICQVLYCDRIDSESDDRSHSAIVTVAPLLIGGGMGKTCSVRMVANERGRFVNGRRFHGIGEQLAEHAKKDGYSSEVKNYFPEAAQ